MQGRTAWAVAALLLVVLVAMTAGLAYAAWSEYRNTIRRVEERAANAVHTAEEHVRWLIEACMQTLDRVGDALAADPGLVAQDEVRDIHSIVRSLPGDTSVWVFDAEGNSILSTSPRKARTNVADEAYFQEIARGAGWRISPLLKSRVDGREVFTISRRMERDGKFVGAAVAVVPADLMSDFYRSLDLGPRSSVGLIRDDGWIVARHPELRTSINLSDHVLFTDYLPRAPSGIYHFPHSPADGEARVVAYRRLEGLPLISVIGISRTAALEGLWSRLGVVGGVAGAVFLLLLFLTGWIVSLLRRDERSRRSLQRSLEHNEMLLREVHHRVKNNLQLVSSLVHLQPGPSESKAELTRRVATMAALHEQIYRANQFAAIDLPDYIRSICDGLANAFGKPVEFRFSIAPLTAHIDTALPLGLMVSEIVANALKHAFPDGRSGTITIALDRADGCDALLRISDDGIGFDPARSVSGLGMRLPEGFSAQISGRHRFETAGGTSFVLTFPLQGNPLEVDGPEAPSTVGT